MSSDVQFTFQSFALNNYAFLVCITAVLYDYILTLSREVEYVWCRPWTWVSTMFVVIRYIGLYWSGTAGLLSGSFVRGLEEVGKIVYLSHHWAFFLFLSTADLLMILRVYAMWNQSRTILCVLLFVYTIQTITTVTVEGIYNGSIVTAPVTTVRILDFPVCGDSIRIASRESYYVVLRMVLSVLLAILAVFQTLKQSFEMYKATKQWQPNRYMQKLAQDGILYSIVHVLYQNIDVLFFAGIPTGATPIFLAAFIRIAFYILIPRFVISIRELYDRDIHGRFHIDTGFGVVSRLNADQDTTVSAMVFVDGNQVAEVGVGTEKSGSFGMGRVHGSRLYEDSPLEPQSSRV